MSVGYDLEATKQPHPNENEINDNVLSFFGTKFGKYQFMNMLYICVPVTLSCIYMVTYVFTSKSLDYRCRIMGCDGEQPNFNPEWLSNAIPFANNKPDQCYKYLKLSNSSNCSHESFNQDVIKHCDDFVFATDKTSILNDFHLECNDNLWKLTIVGTISGVGQFISLPIAGKISDKFGRRRVILIGLIMSSIFGNLRSFAPSYLWFLAFEFLDQFFGSSAYTTSIILGAEIAPPEKRTQMCMILYMCNAIGEIILGTVAWFTTSWRALLRWLYTPGFIIIAFIWLLPESVTWLVAKGRFETVKNMMQKATKMNCIQMPSDETLNGLEKQLKLSTDETSDDSIRQLFKSRILMGRLFNCSFCLLTINFVFFGLVIKSVTIGGNEFLNFILVALIEIPAHITNGFLSHKFGRKKVMCGSLLVAGLACVGFVLLPADIKVLQLVTFMIGKFGITMAFAANFLLAAEVFPTNIRNSAFSIIAMLGFIGGLASPQTALLSEIWDPLPYVVFSSMCIISLLLGLLLPETLNIKLPDTVQEAEDLGKKLKESVT